MVVRVRALGWAALALFIGAGCSVYPDQELHASLDAGQVTGGGDSYRVVHSVTLTGDQKSPEGFPGATREFAARAANPGLSSFTQLQLISPACVPELSASEWEKIDQVEIVQWQSDGAFIAYLIPSGGDYADEIVWYIEEKCKVAERAGESGISSRK